MDNNKKSSRSILIVLILLFFSPYSYSQTPIVYKDCYAVWHTDTLVIGNNKANIKLLKKDKYFDILSVENKVHLKAINFESGSSDITIGNLTDSSRYIDVTIDTNPGNNASKGFLKVEVLREFLSIDIKTIFRIYPECPMIAIDYFIKKKLDSIVFTTTESNLLNLHFTGRQIQ